MNSKLSKESLVLLKKNGVTEEAFFAWLTAKYQFTYNTTLWIFVVFLELIFTSICWSYYQKKPETKNVILGFWLVLNMAIIGPIGFKARLGHGKNNRNASLIHSMEAIYFLHYTDPKKLARLSPDTWKKIKSY